MHKIIHPLQYWENSASTHFLLLGTRRFINKFICKVMLPSGGSWWKIFVIEMFYLSVLCVIFHLWAGNSSLVLCKQIFLPGGGAGSQMLPCFMIYPERREDIALPSLIPCSKVSHTYFIILHWNNCILHVSMTLTLMYWRFFYSFIPCLNILWLASIGNSLLHTLHA